MADHHRQERVIDPPLPRPVKCWIVANKLYASVRTANRAAIKVSRERQKPVNVVELTIDPISSTVRRTGAHQVTAAIEG